MRQPSTYRLYEGSPPGLSLTPVKDGYRVVRSIIDGEDYGEIGDLVAFIPKSRDLARYITKYLNERKKNVRYGREEVSPLDNS